MDTNKDGVRAKIRFKVQNDRMSATMLVGRPTENYIVTMEEIQTALSEEGIKFGICTDRIQAAVDNQTFLTEIPCAQGEPPIPGKDGEIRFSVQTEYQLRPKIRDDGTVDYHDLGLINEIDAGRLLCRRTRPTPGVDGKDIFGVSVPYSPGKYPDFPAGEGTEVSKIDDTKLVASHNGFIKFQNGVISIPDTFVLNGDVNNGTGNINFRGDVIINGCVREGFNVVSGKNIVINGTVEGANIVSSGNVSIRDGFTGMENGQVLAAGDVYSKYLQNAIVKCGGKLDTEYALNSFLTVGGEVHVESGRGTVAGGQVHSLDSIYANNLGADTYISTKIIIDDLPEEFWVLDNSCSGGGINSSTMHEEYEVDPFQDFEIEDSKNDDTPKMLHRNKRAKIVAKNCAYPEVRLQLGVSFFDVERELKCTKFEFREGEIIATPIF